MKTRVSELELLVKFYEEQFRLSQKRRFGASSEKSEYDQLRLDTADETPTDKDASCETYEEPDIECVKEHYRRKRTRKDSLPKDIPVEEILVELPGEEQSCPKCSGALHVMGHEKREELVVIPAKVSVRRYITCTYACRECEKMSEQVPIVKTRAPAPVIKGSFASPEAVAYAMHQKFVMGVPLYRQEQEWRRQDVLLSRQTMTNWLIYSAEHWLSPLYDELRRRLLMREVLHADETTFQVLREPGKKAQSKSYLWCYRTSGDAKEPIVLAEYKPDRGMRNPDAFLTGFSGYLHADGYDAYHKLPPQIVVVGCWAHVRRKWDEALRALRDLSPSVREKSTEMMGKRYLDKLFAIERELAGLDANQRYRQRMDRLKPVMDELFEWAAGVSARPKSLLGTAISYLFSQRKYLQNVLLDGRLELSNNRAERTIKPFVICRKNFLFANTPRGANAASIIFSLVETAKETGVNPFEYLTYVFKTVPNVDIKNSGNLEALLPAGYKKLHDR
ncbi:MAG: IS66 family transposase [Clostridiales bacterium]|nr:IS66 family transposase [Clostridiales bacterium]